MALVVEDGTGKTASESYISVASANTYHDAHGCPAAWKEARDNEKEIALRIATQYLDSFYHGSWIGLKASELQALAWPRIAAYTVDGYLISGTVIPVALKNAVAVAALKELESSGSLSPDISDIGLIESTEIEVGSVREKIVYSGGKTGLKKFTLLHSFLRGIVQPVGFVERG